MSKPLPVRQPKPEDRADGRGMGIGWGMPRRVRVMASGGDTATVIVRVMHGYVWLSISPPFTWEAIMTPETVDDVVKVLELARDEARGTEMGVLGGGGLAYADHR